MSGNSSQKAEIKDFIKNQKKTSKKIKLKKKTNWKINKKSKKNKKNKIIGCFLKILKIAKNPGLILFWFFLVEIMEIQKSQKTLEKKQKKIKKESKKKTNPWLFPENPKNR